jgi:hypothetical protein
MFYPKGVDFFKINSHRFQLPAFPCHKGKLCHKGNWSLTNQVTAEWKVQWVLVIPQIAFSELHPSSRAPPLRGGECFASTCVWAPPFRSQRLASLLAVFGH